jgi:hypothetical protein
MPAEVAGFVTLSFRYGRGTATLACFFGIGGIEARVSPPCHCERSEAIPRQGRSRRGLAASLRSSQ